MSDQAQLLRNKVSAVKSEQVGKMKIITVASGKGGVGKSNFSSNIAIALSSYGKRAMIIDADFGLANIEIMYGKQPNYNLSHLIHRRCTVEQIITPTDYGPSFISGGSGVKEMMFLGKDEIDIIADELSKLEERTDILLIDTGAGINDIVLKFSEIADEMYIIVTPEPASITDAYALIKTVTKDFNMSPTMKIVINKASSREEAHGVFHKLDYVSRKFLHKQLTYAGYVPYDPVLYEAVKTQTPVIIYNNTSKSSSAYKAIAREILQIEEKVEENKLSWRDKIKTVFKR